MCASHGAQEVRLKRMIMQACGVPTIEIDQVAPISGQLIITRVHACTAPTNRRECGLQLAERKAKKCIAAKSAFLVLIKDK